MLLLPDAHFDFEIGVDEVGRGCLAFDAYVAAVAYPKNVLHQFFDQEDEGCMNGIKDSKKMSPHAREKAAEMIKKHAVCWVIEPVSVHDIDTMNIFYAVQEAMKRSVDRTLTHLTQLKCSHKINVLIDGDKFLSRDMYDKEKVHIQCAPQGDAQYLSVASASVLAKVYRDHHVIDLTEEYKNENWDVKYGFKKNKAYGTKQHLQGLQKYGPCRVHRNSFAPIKTMFAFQDI